MVAQRTVSNGCSVFREGDEWKTEFKIPEYLPNSFVIGLLRDTFKYNKWLLPLTSQESELIASNVSRLDYFSELIVLKLETTAFRILRLQHPVKFIRSVFVEPQSGAPVIGFKSVNKLLGIEEIFIFVTIVKP